MRSIQLRSFVKEFEDNPFKDRLTGYTIRSFNLKIW